MATYRSGMEFCQKLRNQSRFRWVLQNFFCSCEMTTHEREVMAEKIGVLGSLGTRESASATMFSFSGGRGTHTRTHFFAEKGYWVMILRKHCSNGYCRSIGGDLKG